MAALFENLFACVPPVRGAAPIFKPPCPAQNPHRPGIVAVGQWPPVPRDHLQNQPSLPEKQKRALSLPEFCIRMEYSAGCPMVTDEVWQRRTGKEKSRLPQKRQSTTPAQNNGSSAAIQWKQAAGKNGVSGFPTYQNPITNRDPVFIGESDSSFLRVQRDT